MKNLFILPTDKPSKLYKSEFTRELEMTSKPLITISDDSPNQHIYITSDEEIKGFENNIWVHNNGRVWLWQNTMALRSNNKPKKIILTTDQELIKDGVQSIDDEFLEWFVKNSSCEGVEIGEKIRYEDEWIDNEDGGEIFQHQYCSYKIIIPKEELSTKLHIGEIVDESYPEAFRKEEPKQEYQSDCICDTECRGFVNVKCKKPKQETIEEFINKSNTPEGLDQFSYDKGLEDGAKWQQERMYSEEEVKHLICQACHHSGVSVCHKFEKWFEQFKKK